ncbi:MAG: hypothetical protein P8Y44_02610 [Acidobacteriota bacterium]
MKRVAIALSSVVALAAGFLTGQAGGLALASEGAPEPEPVETDEGVEVGPLVERARAVWEEDYGFWPSYAFHRQVVRRRLDKNGEIGWSTQYLFEVTPSAMGFDEELIEIDGREPTPEEVLEHRRAGRFEARYESEASLQNPFGKDLPVLPLLFDQRHVYVGRRVVRGYPCLKTVFAARNPPSRAPARQRLGYVFQGDACFSIPGNHLVRAELETAQGVSAGVAGLQYLRVQIESDPVGGKRWLPSRFEVRSDVRVGWKQLRIWNLYRYFDFSYRGSGDSDGEDSTEP